MATHAHTTPVAEAGFLTAPISRRKLSGILPTAALAGMLTGGQGKAAPVSPVQAAWERYVLAGQAADKAHLEFGSIRRALVLQYGEPIDLKKSADELWGHDPRHPGLMRAIKVSNQLGSDRLDALEDLMATPAQSVGDIKIKLSVVLLEWRNDPSICKEAEPHDMLALGFMEEAERGLGAAA
jgi:hypothetical protein